MLKLCQSYVIFYIVVNQWVIRIDWILIVLAWSLTDMSVCCCRIYGSKKLGKCWDNWRNSPSRKISRPGSEMVFLTQQGKCRWVKVWWIWFWIGVDLRGDVERFALGRLMVWMPLRWRARRMFAPCCCREVIKVNIRGIAYLRAPNKIYLRLSR